MPFRRPLVLLALALLAVLTAAAARAEAPVEPTLTGVVRDLAEAPLPGATVTATSQTTQASRSTITAGDGSYSLTLPAGKYEVKVSAPGYRMEILTVDVAAGAPNVVDVSLSGVLNEAITVTATKHEQAPLDVPFSVAARTEQEMNDRGIDSIEAVAGSVVGFTVQNLGPGQSQVAMRGVSAGQIARDQPGVKEQVGIYLDEAPVSLSLFTPDLDLVDVNRVEVLRGPQGTLFGSGSVTGTVRYVTNPPVLGAMNGFVEAGAGMADGGSATGDLKAGLNIPLGEKTAARVVGYYTRLAGFTEDIQPDMSTNSDTNDGFRAGGRAAVTFEASDKLTITPRVIYQKVESNGWNREDTYNILANPFTTTRPPVSFDERQQFTQYPEEYTDDFALGSVDLRYDFGELVLTSITSYSWRDLLVVRDTTALTASFTGATLGFPEPVYTLDSPLFDRTNAKAWTQELRISREQARLQWLAGLYYSHGERDYGQDVTIPGFTAATGVPTQGLLAPEDSIYFSEFDYELEQYALFGEATASVTDRFRLTGGLRYYDFSEDKQQLVDGLGGNPNNGVSVLSLPGQTDANGFAPRLIAAYDLTKNAIFNAQVSRGFRLGGINDPLNVPLCSAQDLITFGGHETWDDETVWNYEVGFKSRVLGGSGSFNASAFYVDIEDLQTTVTAGTCSSRVVFNVPQARSQGVELEFAHAPTRNFDFTLSGTYTDAELQSTLTSTDNAGNVSIVSGIEDGRRLPSVPQEQAAAAATWQYDAFRGSRGYVTGSYQYVGSRFTQVGDEDLGVLDMVNALPNPNGPIGAPFTQNTFTYDPELPAYSLLNLRVGVRNGVWDISAYVNNVLDELALLAFDRERGTAARIGYLTNQPRTFGISTRYNF